MSAVMQTIVLDALSIRVSRTKGNATVAWQGVSDSRSPGESLSRVTRQICTTLKRCEVVVDYSGLEFVNSATIAPLIQFVRSLSTNGCAVLVLFDADSDWQRTHMLCMKTIARTLTGVRVEGRKTGAKDGTAAV
jgi:anti-anti-sigma regulatory factor